LAPAVVGGWSVPRQQVTDAIEHTGADCSLLDVGQVLDVLGPNVDESWRSAVGGKADNRQHLADHGRTVKCLIRF
jgi:hypothetical protein